MRGEFALNLGALITGGAGQILLRVVELVGVECSCALAISRSVSSSSRRALCWGVPELTAE